MLGAIIGDIVGSRFEWQNHKSKGFEFFSKSGGCRPTDDSIMTLAVAQAIIDSNGDENALFTNAVRRMQEYGRRYPNAGYGGRFRHWLKNDDPQPYSSWGNGAAMRVSPCAFAAKTLEEAKMFSLMVTSTTHNHPEGIKGAEATTVAIFMAKNGSSLSEIQDVIIKKYYKIDFKLDDIRATNRFNSSCQGSVPQAMEAFFESTGFEDAVRNAISIGGDSDTIAAITGSIAEAYYGIPAEIRKKALSFLDPFQLTTIKAFESLYGTFFSIMP